MANVEKLEAVLDYIRLHPEEHDQENWASRDLPGGCGTTLCFAGHTVTLNGHKILWGNEHWWFSMTCALPGDETRLIRVAAKEILDLDDDQTESLFQDAKTFDDVERVVKDIINYASTERELDRLHSQGRAGAA